MGNHFFCRIFLFGRNGRSVFNKKEKIFRLFVVLTCPHFQCCLVISLVIFTGNLESKYDDRAWPAFILGWIMFIPGAFYMKVIVCAFFNLCDHKFEDIPHFNN